MAAKKKPAPEVVDNMTGDATGDLPNAPAPVVIPQLSVAAPVERKFDLTKRKGHAEIQALLAEIRNVSNSVAPGTTARTLHNLVDQIQDLL